MKDKYDFIRHSPATVAGRFLSGNMTFLLCFLLFSGTALFAQEANNPPVTYPAAPDLFGGPMGIERVPHTGFPVHAHHPVYTSEVNTYTVDDMLHEYRVRAGKPAPTQKQANFWIDRLHGSNAGRFMLGAGNYLRWTEDKRLRTRLNEVVDGIEECRDPNGYYIMGYPENMFFYHENSGYCRSMVTQGLIEASIAGNPKALPMLRACYDWFNRSPYLSELVHRGHFGRQGIIASMRLYNTPVGKPEDLQVVQRYYIEDYWMKQLVDRDVDAIWKLPYDRPHCYLIPTLESYADLYKATGEQQYLDAVFGGWDLYKEYYQHIGGAISVCEGAPFPPKSNLLDGRTGELCGNVFWIFLNQRLHLLYPEEEKYVNEIEKEEMTCFTFFTGN